ncbi:Uncharacterized protein HZ326_9484 [Fusarium oxysporum f. sp. albedinis]|nr:Uncharacterized protein HZ326_9484 [Fusarium oxysporum f. sp. albedinis]
METIGGTDAALYSTRGNPVLHCSINSTFETIKRNSQASRTASSRPGVQLKFKRPILSDSLVLQHPCAIVGNHEVVANVKLSLTSDNRHAHKNSGHVKSGVRMTASHLTAPGPTLHDLSESRPSLAHASRDC